MTTLILIRHGPTIWNQEKRLQGRNDIPLSTEGRKSVSTWRMVPEISGATWVSSPLSRALETASILGAHNLQVEPLLAEMSWGHWEGRNVDDVRAETGHPDLNGGLGLEFRPPGGNESRRDVIERVTPFWKRVGAAGKTTVAVTHKGIIEAIMAAATGWDMRSKRPAKVGLGASHVFEVSHIGQISVIRLNDNGDDRP